MAILASWAEIEADDVATECFKFLNGIWRDGDIYRVLDTYFYRASCPNTTARLILHGVARSFKENHNPLSIANCALFFIADRHEGLSADDFEGTDPDVIRLFEALTATVAAAPEGIIRALGLVLDECWGLSSTGIQAGMLDPTLMRKLRSL